MFSLLISEVSSSQACPYPEHWNSLISQSCYAPAAGIYARSPCAGASSALNVHSHRNIFDTSIMRSARSCSFNPKKTKLFSFISSFGRVMETGVELKSTSVFFFCCRSNFSFNIHLQCSAGESKILTDNTSASTGNNNMRKAAERKLCSKINSLELYM